MFEAVFDSVIPQTSLEIEQLQQQAAELQQQRLAEGKKVIVKLSALEQLLREELFKTDPDQLESFRQFQAWQKSQSNAEVIPEQSYAE
jgi:hypothetical protein